jgi:hypothetical protein
MKITTIFDLLIGASQAMPVPRQRCSNAEQYLVVLVQMNATIGRLNRIANDSYVSCHMPRAVLI